MGLGSAITGRGNMVEKLPLVMARHDGYGSSIKAIGEWLNKLWYMIVIEYYCAVRSNELDT